MKSLETPGILLLTLFYVFNLCFFIILTCMIVCITVDGHLVRNFYCLLYIHDARSCELQ